MWCKDRSHELNPTIPFYSNANVIAFIEFGKIRNFKFWSGFRSQILELQNSLKLIQFHLDHVSLLKLNSRFLLFIHLLVFVSPSHAWLIVQVASYDILLICELVICEFQNLLEKDSQIYIVASIQNLNSPFDWTSFYLK